MPRPGATIVSSLDPMRVRRVHQHDARDDGRIEHFLDQLGVMAGHSGCREQSLQAVAAKRGDSVWRSDGRRVGKRCGSIVSYRCEVESDNKQKHKLKVRQYN